MKKIWYIEIDGKREGPYSVWDLKRDPRISRHTLVWRQGFASWVPICLVPELKGVFRDEQDEERPEEEPTGAGWLPPDELVLEWRGNRIEPPVLFLLLLIAVLLLSYFIYQLST